MYGETKKSYKQIVSSGGKFVAGVAIDETGSPITSVPVQVCGHKKPRADGRFSLTFSGSFDVLNSGSHPSREGNKLSAKAFVPLASSISGLNIGCGFNSAAGTFWSGLVDEVRIYNRAVIP